MASVARFLLDRFEQLRLAIHRGAIRRGAIRLGRRLREARGRAKEGASARTAAAMFGLEREDTSGTRIVARKTKAPST